MDEPVVLADLSNLLLHLRPAPVVARVATTTAVLRPSGASLQREVEVAGYLAAAGAPVVAPSRELPAGPHERDGLRMTFWQYAEPGEERVDPRTAGRTLREMHDLLREFPGAEELVPLGNLFETERMAALVRERGLLEAADAERLAAAAERARERVEALDRPLQPVHGDAHLSNVLATPAGLAWIDFEDTFLGPVEWDLACIAHRRDADTEAALAAYGPHDADALAAVAEARAVQEVGWVVITAERFPRFRAAARDLVASLR